MHHHSKRTYWVFEVKFHIFQTSSLDRSEIPLIYSVGVKSLQYPWKGWMDRWFPELICIW
jgi:hypothetical protein